MNGNDRTTEGFNVKEARSTPFYGQLYIEDVRFKLYHRDTSLSLRHVASAMLPRDASSRLVTMEIDSFRGSTDVPEKAPLVNVMLYFFRKLSPRSLPRYARRVPTAQAATALAHRL